MTSKQLLQRYRKWYAKLLRLYSKSFYERFREGMEQTFNDILRERAKDGKGLFSYVAWMFIETSGSIFKNNIKSLNMRNKRIMIIAIVTVVLLMVPMVAMQFTAEVNWSWSDFVTAGILLFGTGLTYELVARKAVNTTYRFAAGIAVATALLLIWTNLAVGLIKSENSPANLLFLGVLAVGFIGAVIARLNPIGMSRALFATAFVQALVPVIAMMIWKSQITSSLVEMLGITAFFVVPWVVSALLFQVSTRKRIETKVIST